jgi:hypothetical protein
MKLVLVPVLVLGLVLGLASCKGGPEQILAGNAKADGVEVKTRRSTAKDGKLAWGGLVTNTSDRFVRGADVAIVVRKGGGTAIGEGKTHVDLLPPGYGVLVEVNGIAFDGSPSSVDVVLEKVDVAPPEERPLAWKDAAATWTKPLPAGVAFAIQEDEKCAGVLGKKGEPTTFRCVVGLRHTGTVPARSAKLWFHPARGGENIAVRAPYPTDLPIEPGDALVYFVQAKMSQPSETILTGTAERL